MGDTKEKTEKETYYEAMMTEIMNHADYGKRNPVDIGLDCGYSERELMEMVQWVQTEEKTKAWKNLPKLSITSFLQIAPGEETIFSDQSVHIGSTINCNGTLRFCNCAVFYHETENMNEIMLSDQAELIFERCKIICSKPEQAAFIHGSGNRIVFKNCYFESNSNLLKVSNVKAEFIMQHCQIVNCTRNFVSVSLSSTAVGKISGNKIEVSDVMACRSVGRSNPCFKLFIDDSGFLEIEKNIVKGVPELNEENINLRIFDFGKFSGKCRPVFRNCLFSDISGCISGAADIEKCVFKNSRYILENSSQDIRVADSYFENCTNVLLWLGEGSSVSNCQFIDCYNQLISSSMCGGINIEFCEFANISHKKQKDFVDENCIILQRGPGADTLVNKMYKCTFNGGRLGLKFLVGTSSDRNAAKVSKTVANITDCSFLSYVTKRSDNQILDAGVQNSANGVVKTFNILNCKGLDKINAGDSNADPEYVESIREKRALLEAAIKNEKVDM